MCLKRQEGGRVEKWEHAEADMSSNRVKQDWSPISLENEIRAISPWLSRSLSNIQCKAWASVSEIWYIVLTVCTIVSSIYHVECRRYICEIGAVFQSFIDLFAIIISSGTSTLQPEICTVSQGIICPTSEFVSLGISIDEFKQCNLYRW